MYVVSVRVNYEHTNIYYVLHVCMKYECVGVCVRCDCGRGPKCFGLVSNIVASIRPIH